MTALIDMALRVLFLFKFFLKVSDVRMILLNFFDVFFFLFCQVSCNLRNL